MSRGTCSNKTLHAFWEGELPLPTSQRTVTNSGEVGGGERESVGWVKGDKKVLGVSDTYGTHRGEGYQTRNILKTRKMGGFPVCDGS